MRKKLFAIFVATIVAAGLKAETIFSFDYSIGHIEVTGSAYVYSGDYIEFQSGNSTYIEISPTEGIFHAGDIIKIIFAGKTSGKTASVGIYDDEGVKIATSPNSDSYSTPFNFLIAEDMNKIRIARAKGNTYLRIYQLDVIRGEEAAIPYPCPTSFNGLSYILNNNMTAEVAINNNVGSNVIIPGVLTISNLSFNITSIQRNAFAHCTNLTSLSLGENISTYGDSAFYDCTSLQTIYNYREFPAKLGTDAFKNVDYFVCTLYVPSETAVGMYTSANSSWKDYFYHIKVLEKQPEEVDTKAGEYAISYVNIENDTIYEETITLHVPVEPVIEGFTFIGWFPIADTSIENGISIQAIYKANELTSAPAVYTNPANPAQKLIRNCNIYILTEDKTYTITGQQVK